MSDPAHEPIKCPECRSWMLSGFVAVSSGLLWVRRANGPYNDFSESIPGTNAIMRANRLPAWKCPACRLVTFRFGHDVHRNLDQPVKLDAPGSAGGGAGGDGML